ncbi:MAG: hypothetical protein ACYDAO_04660 [Thermoplasmataceae archaeon]
MNNNRKKLNICNMQGNTILEKILLQAGSKRWFPFKSEKILNFNVIDSLPATVSSGEPFIMLVNIETSGGSNIILFAMVLKWDEDATDEVSMNGFEILDSIESGDISSYIGELCRVGSIKGSAGKIALEGEFLTEFIKNVREKQEFKALAVEQSNSSFILNGKYVCKFLRRPASESNPDVLIPKKLYMETQFRNTPQPVGHMVYRNGKILSIMSIQEYVVNSGDYWHYFTELSSMLLGKSKNEGDYETKIISEMKTATSEIARITAEMHEGLSLLRGKEFEPIIIGKEYTHKIRSGYLDMVKGISNYKINLKLGNEIKNSNELCESLENLLEKIDFNKVEGSMAIRVHGDFHLGQILKTVRGPMVLDFEGEPLRTDRERSSRHSPMKDVAGMIRSIDYALNFSVRNGDGNSELARKESNILRNIFLEEYWNAASGLNLIPSSFVKFEKSSEYFELEKAIYELNYELKNRPEWVGIPGNAIAKIIQMMK